MSGKSPTVAELKAKLKARGLKVSGKKSHLLARLRGGVKSRAKKRVKSVKRKARKSSKARKSRKASKSRKARKARKARKKSKIKPRVMSMSELVNKNLSLIEIEKSLKDIKVVDIKKSPIYKSMSAVDKKKKKAAMVKILSGKIHSSRRTKKSKVSKKSSRSRRPPACSWVLDFERKFTRLRLQ